MISALLRGYPGKVGDKLFKGLTNVLWDGPDVAGHGHEIMIALPAGDDVKMEMIGNAGSGNFSKVEADVESMRLQMVAKDDTASLHHGHKGCVFSRRDFADVCYMPSWGNQQVAVGIGKPVEQNNGLPAPMQEEPFGVGLAYSGRFKQAARYFFCLAQDMFHAPGGP